MRIFVAGASGVIGTRLIPLLVKANQFVSAMTRTEGKAVLLRSLGATPVVCDVYDVEMLRRVVNAAQPSVIINLLTDLPDDIDRIMEFAESNNRIRREGTRNLLDAAAASHVSQFVAQSVAWDLEGNGASAVRSLEDSVLRAGGHVVRYGRFYGPDTYYDRELPENPRIHIDDAALRTVSLIDSPSPIVVVADE